MTRCLAVAAALLSVPAVPFAGDTAARDAALQAAADRFVGITPGVDEAGHARPLTITLNDDAVVQDGTRYDGFRFTAPDDGAKLLVWGFRKQQNLSGWYILPVHGTMRGFTRFVHDKDAKDRTVILQTLPASNLRAGEDYIIWFSFEDAEPTDVTVWLRFASPSSAPTSYAAIRAVLNPAPEE